MCLEVPLTVFFILLRLTKKHILEIIKLQLSINTYFCFAFVLVAAEIS